MPSIQGRYISRGPNVPAAPYLRAGITLPRLGIGSFVNFLVDTGADFTALHPRDIGALGLDYTQLLPETLGDLGGVGGHARTFVNLPPFL